MEKKDAYLVLKNQDIEKYLSKEEKDQLNQMIGKIRDGRLGDKKNPSNTYYICNVDEPYASDVYQAILDGEAIKNGKENNPLSEVSFDFTKDELEGAVDTLNAPSSHIRPLIVNGEGVLCYDSALVRAMEIAIQAMEKAKESM